MHIPENCVIHLSNIDVLKNSTKILSDISWRLNQDENWLILGSNGSGKTSFLKLARGDLWPAAGSRLYSFDGKPQESPVGIKKLIALVSPEMQDAYIKNSWDITAEEIIHTGFRDTIWLFETPSPEQIIIADNIMNQLNIESLRKKSMLQLSSGEAKRVLIARAIISSPRVLMLDEVSNDLDADSRKSLILTIDNIAKSGTQIIYSTHMTEDMPDSITNALLLSRGRIKMQGDKKTVLSAYDQDNQNHAIDNINNFNGTKKYPAPYCRTDRSPLIEMIDINVFINDQHILHNINWRINHGEHWLITGKNGAGKSTLLKLILAELHPASGGRLSRSGFSDDESVWQIREKIGYISSSLQGCYDWDLTAEEVVLSGIFSSIGLYDEASAEQKETALKWMNILQIDDLRQRRLFALSYGEARKVLLARAMVNSPDMLLLDEPCNGLDSTARRDFLMLVEKLAQLGTTILMATHHKNEIIPSIT